MTISLNTLTDDEVIYALTAGEGRFHCATRRLGCSRKALRERIRESFRVNAAYRAILKRRRSSNRNRKDNVNRRYGLFDNLDWLTEGEVDE